MRAKKYMEIERQVIKRDMSVKQQKGTRKLERQMAAESEVAGYSWHEALQFPK